MTRRQIAAKLRRMRALYAEGRLEDAVKIATVLLPHCHEVVSPVIEVIVKRA